jgi:hypothetical protein
MKRYFMAPTAQPDRTPTWPRPTLDLTALVRAEYLEMPGLCLTAGQAARLWNVGRDECLQTLDALIRSGFLYRTRDLYIRTGSGRSFA